jgi:hypothetical protein
MDLDVMHRQMRDLMKFKHEVETILKMPAVHDWLTEQHKKEETEKAADDQKAIDAAEAQKDADEATKPEPDMAIDAEHPAS